MSTRMESDALLFCRLITVFRGADGGDCAFFVNRNAEDTEAVVFEEEARGGFFTVTVIGDASFEGEVLGPAPVLLAFWEPSDDLTGFTTFLGISSSSSLSS